MQESKNSFHYGVAKLSDRHVVAMNAVYATWLGYEVGTRDLQIPIEQFFDAEAISILDEYIQKEESVDETNETTNLTHFSSNGVPVSLAVIARRCKWKGQLAIELVGLDLASLMRRSQAKIEQDHLFRDMILKSAQGILVHRRFKPVLVNESWAALQGADSVEQVLAMDSILDLLPHDNTEAVLKHYDALIAGQRSGTSTVVENVGLDGVSRYFNIYDNVIDWQGESAVHVVIEDVSDKVALERQLTYRANHDDLTGLYNRRAIYDWADSHLAESAALTCLLLDIDDFKQINDSYGHSIGDHVICSLAEVITKTVCDVGGIVGRWGGEEFICFIPHANHVQTEQLARRVCNDFAALLFRDVQQALFSATVSIGVSCNLCCHEEFSIDQLIHNTDKLLYTAKAQGKNRVCHQCHC